MTKDEQIATLKSALRYYANNLLDFAAKRAREALAAVDAAPIDIDAAYKRLCQSTLASDMDDAKTAAEKAHAALPEQERRLREIQGRKDFLLSLKPLSREAGYDFDMSCQQWRSFVHEWFKKEYGY